VSAPARPLLARFAVRPLDRGDLPAVSRLFARALAPTRPSPAEQAAWFARTLLDHPWVDPEIPSLVCEAPDGAIVGFIGAAARRMRLGDRPIRVAYAAHLSSDPALASGAPGGLLLRRFLAGPQELSVGDTASARVRQMWEAAGGEGDDTASVSWFHLFHPVRAGLSMAGGLGPWGRRVAPLARAARRLPARSGGGPGLAEGLRTEMLTPAAMVAALADVMADRLLVPDYDEGYLAWLLGAVAEEPPGGILARMVLRGDRPIGWYVVRPSRGGVARALDVRARARDLDDVVGAMFAGVRALGAAGLRGRLDPGMLEPVSARRCLFHPIHRVVMHARDAEVLRAVRDRRAALSPLLGEWW
jgi:hypothetical protein